MRTSSGRDRASGRGRRAGDGWWARLRSRVHYGTSLRLKLIVPVILIAILVVGALTWAAFVTLQSSIASIYEQQARSVAAVISKSIQEAEYILYYSEALDADIGRLLERYESIIEITVAGQSARGFLIIAGTDRSLVGNLVSDRDQERYDRLQTVAVERVRAGGRTVLRADHPIFSGSDLIGVVSIDMSSDEQARYIAQLSWRFSLGAGIGVLLLGGLLYLALRAIVTRPVRRLAEAMGFVARRIYDVEIDSSVPRTPGTRIRDEISRLISGFNLMTRVIHSHEQELRKMVVLDEETGAYNREHFRVQLDQELNKGRRYKHPTSLLVVDVDGLDGQPEEERRAAMIAVTGFLVRNLRKVDVLFRFEETRFCALLPETPSSGAKVAADRLRQSVPDLQSETPLPVSLRIEPIGWSTEESPTAESVLARLGSSLENFVE